MHKNKSVDTVRHANTIFKLSDEIVVLRILGLMTVFNISAVG